MKYQSLMSLIFREKKIAFFFPFHFLKDMFYKQYFFYTDGTGLKPFLKLQFLSLILSIGHLFFFCTVCLEGL